MTVDFLSESKEDRRKWYIFQVRKKRIVTCEFHAQGKYPSGNEEINDFTNDRKFITVSLADVPSMNG
jgi:hypothetical protein